jgi:hypothetical protein
LQSLMSRRWFTLLRSMFDSVFRTMQLAKLIRS